jgi:hypothetical protein
MAFGSKIEKINNKIDEMRRPLFIGVLFIWHLLYFLVFMGFVFLDPTYIHYMSVLIQVFITGFLMLRFHPFRTHAVSGFDALVIFTSATFLLTNFLATELLAAYLPAIEKYLKSTVQRVVKNTPTATPSSMLSSQKIPSSTPTATTAVTSLPTDIHGENILLGQTY